MTLEAVSKPFSLVGPLLRVNSLVLKFVFFLAENKSLAQTWFTGEAACLKHIAPGQAEIRISKSDTK